MVTNALLAPALLLALAVLGLPSAAVYLALRGRVRTPFVAAAAFAAFLPGLMSVARWVQRGRCDRPPRGAVASKASPDGSMTAYVEPSSNGLLVGLDAVEEGCPVGRYRRVAQTQDDAHSLAPRDRIAWTEDGRSFTVFHRDAAGTERAEFSYDVRAGTGAPRRFPP